MKRNLLITWVLVAWALGALSLVAQAQTEGLLNKLLAPGPLVQGHLELEKRDCLKCHETGQGVPDGKCLVCHKEIKTFVENKKGFHGLNTKNCLECHTDHKGRTHDTLAIDEKSFNHKDLTGYSLEGKHSEIKCTDCHKAKYSNKYSRPGKTRFIGAQASCVSCHKKEDKHFFKGDWAKKDCSACHDSRSWKENLKFSHDKDTKYKLEGKHNALKCADCHGPNKTFKLPSYTWGNLKQQQCLTCHQDTHKNNLSLKYKNGNCTTCHAQDSWKIPDFDHQKTNYPLSGKHAEAKCIDCHKQNATLAKQKELVARYNFTGLKTQCLACHDNYHLFGKLQSKQFKDLNACHNCHTEKDWKTTRNFDHNINTKYRIDGEHTKLNCLDCHTKEIRTKKPLSTAIYQWANLPSKTCESCHKTPHKGQFSEKMLQQKCIDCHITTGWTDFKSGAGFDHSKTRFALTGAHKSTKCADCHGPSKKQVFKFQHFDNKFCKDCHENIHSNQFSTKINSENCQNCHSTENFQKRLEFDHSKTRYQLDGAHLKLQCADCHKPSSSAVVLQRPNFSPAGNQKNSETINKKITLNQFQFPHLKQTECLSCHQDYHKGQLSSQCLNCHQMNSWKDNTFKHNTNSTFLLKGKHQDLKCSECHKIIPNDIIRFSQKDHKLVKYKPISSACTECHTDKHKGSFGSKCQECHNESGWKSTKDFHKNFSLTGVHFSVSCNECHVNNKKLSGFSDRCYVCHQKDDVHSGTLPNCQDCHRQQFWEDAKFRHSLTNFPLRGAHRTIDCIDCHRTGTYKGLSSTCGSCHLTKAMTVTTPAHSGFSNLNRCNECHLNHFSWD